MWMCFTIKQNVYKSDNLSQNNIFFKIYFYDFTLQHQYHMGVTIKARKMTEIRPLPIKV